MNGQKQQFSLPPYSLSRVAAEAVHRQLTALAGSSPSATAATAPQPDPDAIQAMIDAAFWASLRREEGETPIMTLAYLPPGPPGSGFTFEQSLPLSPEPLTRLAPAVERPGIHLGVWRQNGELRVWGAKRRLPELCLVVEVIAPGLLVIKHSHTEGSRKFANIALLEGDELKILNPRADLGCGASALADALCGLAAPGDAVGSGAVLVKLALSMRAHRRGGALLIVPSGTEAWRESFVKPIRYAVSPAFASLSRLLRSAAAEQDHHWQTAVESAVHSVAGLTAVDGAAVLTDSYEVLAFGAMIGRRYRSPEIENVLVIEPVQGSSPQMIPAAQIGGTRHLSAAQFVHDQRDSAALVASKDGRFTVFDWSGSGNMVHAHRIEALLL